MEKQGKGPREIAHTLGLSANEVSKRLEAIHRKLTPPGGGRSVARPRAPARTERQRRITGPRNGARPIRASKGQPTAAVFPGRMPPPAGLKQLRNCPEEMRDG
jgi:hypothetical protein